MCLLTLLKFTGKFLFQAGIFYMSFDLDTKHSSVVIFNFVFNLVNLYLVCNQTAQRIVGYVSRKPTE